MTNKEIGFIKIHELVTRFNEQLTAYKKSDYNETQTRRDFIDPFFKALGWDIDNKQGFAESYREVIHEDRVKVGKATKAPDYSFRLGGGQRLFFVEAKKPSVLIKDDIQPAYQVRRYGWSAKLNVSVITDFEEFAIYDCTKKPNPTDKSSVARVKYFTYQEYEKEWDFLWNTFSKEAVLKGSFDKFIGGNANKKGTATVDKEFLNSLDEWRTLLAETISKENKQLDEDELNFVVQQTLDRIIFLRICEDRSIEPYGSLQDAVKSGDYYKNLLQEFKQADDKYNSGLFDFKKDTLSHQLIVNNKTLKTIINQLYYPECPYEFSVLSVEILGSAYEQFLGKTITINAKGKAVIELKPEVRKAGGVYYTPQYVVDYIVKNTIGKLCENKTPTQVAEIKIVDPACGSGSFLLGAYQYLLNWHKDYYTQNPNKKNPLTPEGILTTTEKKKILLNNIYGVDIDTNAVEVTKLSLLLKCMEGETQASIAHQMTMFKERVLPTLDENIKSGNSLIDTDYYDNQLDFGEERKIKPFSWNAEFNTILPKGFDAVIGNPPYIKERGSKEIFEPVLKSKIGKLYHQGKMDFWYYFVHRGIDILKPNGFLAFITNSYWMRSDGASKLIDRIEKEFTINTIVDFDNFKVFEDVSGKHNISIFTKGQNKKANCKILSIDKQNPSSDIAEYKLLKISNENLFANSKLNIQTSENIFENCDLLDNHFDTSVGVQESTDKITRTQKEKTKRTDINIGDGVFVLTENEVKILGFTKEETTLLKPYVNTLHIKRYALKFANEYLLYIGKQEREDIAKGKYPNVKKHLDNVKEFITSSNAPYGIHRTREQRYFEEPKLICKGMFLKPDFYLDEDKYYCGFSFSVIIQKSKEYDLKLLLAIMNSKLGEYWFNLNGKKRGVGVDIGVKVFRLFPLPPKTNASYNQTSEDVIKTVNQLTELNKQLSNTTLHTALQQLERQINHIENKINTLVYQLYNLTEDEIKLIENN
jgi:adenine-specific DNA-methyltransferase